MKPKTLMFRANGDANSYALIDADTGKWVLSLLANGEMHAAEQIALLERVAQCWNTAAEFAGLPKRKLESLLSEGWQINGVSLQRTQEDGTVKHAACTTGGMVLWWQPEQERVIATSVRSVMQRALKALEFADEKTNELHIEFEGEDSRYAIFDDTITAIRQALAAPNSVEFDGIKTEPARQECRLCGGMGYNDGSGDACANCSGTGASAPQQAPDALNGAAQHEPVAWVWNPASEAWERVHVFGFWQPGAIYAFGPTPPADPQPDTQPAPQEPVAWRFPKAGTSTGDKYHYTESMRGEEDRFLKLWQPLYTTPPPAQQEPVAVVGNAFQLLWARHDWSKGLKVGDLLYAGPQTPSAPRDEPTPQAVPVAWLHPANVSCVTTDPTAYARGIPLYTAPQAQPAQQEPDRLHLAAMNLARMQQDRIVELELQLADWLLGIKRHPEMEKRIAELEQQLEARVPDDRNKRLREAFSQALGDTYVCGRVWDAWNYGTMTQDDFQPAGECPEVLDSLIAAAHGITLENAPPKAPGAPE